LKIYGDADVTVSVTMLKVASAISDAVGSAVTGDEGA